MTPVATGAVTEIAVCAVADLVPDLGVAALIGHEQVAVFLLSDGTVHAVQNLDPFSGAAVLSRGITGSRGDVPTIASPVYKQVFSLVDGSCLVTMDALPRNGLSPDLVVHRAEVRDGTVFVTLADRS